MGIFHITINTLFHEKDGYFLYFKKRILKVSVAVLNGQVDTLSVSDISIEEAIEWDKKHCWHPFTRQSEWCAPEHTPLMIERADGVWLYDSEGNGYIDGNASIWTNIHGHNHPVLNEAIKKQLNKVAHTSFLGFGHPLASELAYKLSSFFPKKTLSRVFFSDDGSTAIECALKMALQYRMQNGQSEKKEFIAFCNGYHGDTMGAAALGGVSAFFKRFESFGMKVRFVNDLEELKKISASELTRIAGVVVEPLIQGVNQMHVWQSGMLHELREWTTQQDIHLILDEVMTGFGRTGEMFACQKENVIPDFLCLAKGLTAGYMAMAATLVRENIYDAFLGEADKAFYYGHSYTANPLGCAVALASLELFKTEQTISSVKEKSLFLEQQLNLLSSNIDEIYETRRCGLVAGIELRNSDSTKFDSSLKIGEKVCFAARKYQLLTRPILDTIVFLPPLSITRDEIEISFAALEAAIREVTEQ